MEVDTFNLCFVVYTLRQASSQSAANDHATRQAQEQAEAARRQLAEHEARGQQREAHFASAYDQVSAQCQTLQAQLAQADLFLAQARAEQQQAANSEYVNNAERQAAIDAANAALHAAEQRRRDDAQRLERKHQEMEEEKASWLREQQANAAEVARLRALLEKREQYFKRGRNLRHAAHRFGDTVIDVDEEDDEDTRSSPPQQRTRSESSRSSARQQAPPPQPDLASPEASN